MYDSGKCMTLTPQVSIDFLDRSLCRPPLRRYLIDGEHSLSSTLAQAVTKLALRYTLLQPDPKKHNV